MSSVAMLTHQPNSLRTLLAFSTVLAATGLAVAQSADASKDKEEVVLDTVEVTAAASSAYSPPASSDVGKGGVPLSENPQNISVVNRSLLDDLSVVRLEDALRGVAGVTTGGYYGGWDYFRIRGFDADFNTYIDGLRGSNGMGEETFGLEQVEVVKGPAALYGSGPIGGLVNLVSKRPVDTAFTKIGATVGSYDYHEGTIDFNQPLNDSKNVLFRLNILAREQDSNIDYVGNERLYIAPSLTWKISDATTLTVLARYRDITGTADMPLPAIGTVLPNPNGQISSDFFTGLAGSNQLEENYQQIGYSLLHEFSDDLKLTQNLRYARYEQTWDDIYYPVAFPAPYDTLYLAPYDYYQKWNYTSVDTRLDFTVEQGAVIHNLTAGADYFRKNLENESSMGAGWFDATQLTPLNVYNPVYTGVPAQAMVGPFYGTEMTEITGLYLQDHVVLPRKVTLTAGGRFDFTETAGVHDHAFTPRGGATWEFLPDAILYASYSESFKPQSDATTGTALTPETGDNIEVGLRNRFFGGRLATTAALYQITRANVTTANPVIPTAVVTTGEQRSRGIELDARYTPVKGWELLAAYAYTDTEITEDNTLPVGARIAGVPLHTFSAWTKYTLQNGALRGVGFGLGATHYSAQDGDRGYTAQFELPGYTLWQAAIYYTRGPFSAQLNITNLFDEKYYVGAYDALYVMPGEPRLMRLSASWTF
jgi:iron complex outermembrane recepter protein